MLLSLTGGGREIKSRIKRGPKGHNQEKRMGIITRQSRNHARTAHIHAHILRGSKKESQVMTTVFRPSIDGYRVHIFFFAPLYVKYDVVVANAAIVMR